MRACPVCERAGWQQKGASPVLPRPAPSHPARLQEAGQFARAALGLLGDEPRLFQAVVGVVQVRIEPEHAAQVVGVERIASALVVFLDHGYEVVRSGVGVPASAAFGDEGFFVFVQCVLELDLIHVIFSLLGFVVIGGPRGRRSYIITLDPTKTALFVVRYQIDGFRS